ncbi:MAG: DNA-binding response regulator [Ardenticatenaceae bacterium]|nr:DNA-binding response regulator [Ardenticatenaceae bacterium]
MSKITLLLADNDQDFLIICGEYLENCGYHVIQAHGREQAQQALETTNIHLAILDLRLTDDTDEKDRSGLIIAETVARQVPKIILTKFPTYQDVVKALKLDTHTLPPAVDFVDKREGLDKLRQSIVESLTHYAQINWDLAIQWNGYLALSQVVNLIEPGLERTLLSERSAEFEDLLRKLFFEHAQVTISDIFSHQDDHLILPVFTHNPHGLKMYLLYCGQVETMNRENRLYETAVPQRIITEKISRVHTAQTLHFAAATYTLNGGNLEEIVTLNQFIRRQALAESLTAINHLYRQELSKWYEWGRFRNETTSLSQFYRHKLGLPENMPGLQTIVTDIYQKALAAGLPLQLNMDSQQLVVNEGNGRSYTYPHPMKFLIEPDSDPTYAAQWGTVHGNVNDTTVLVNPSGETWLIDFRHVTRAPLVCDFVSLETAVKCQLLNTTDLPERHDLEQRLLNWQETENTEGLAGETAVALQLITRIRHWAQHLTGCDPATYNQALALHSLSFLTTYQPHKFYTRRDLLPYSHALLTASMLLASHSSSTPTPANFWLDQPNQMVWVEGQGIGLTSQEFQILSYLYSHNGQLCERQAIVESALGEIYDEFDPEQSRLNSAMSRLIQKVEPDPRNRKYFTTIRGRGYKLQT